MQIVMGELNGVRLLDLLNRSLKVCHTVHAAVAYADMKNRFFESCKKHNLRLTYFGLLDFDGAVPVPLLEDFLRQGPLKADCYLVNGHFHTKVIWWHGFGAYIGSANLTHAAWFNNIECGVFYEEAELSSLGIDSQLDGMFDHLKECSMPLTDELVSKLRHYAQKRQRWNEQKNQLRNDFDAIFGKLQHNKGLTVVAPKGVKENIAERRFVQEWGATLQLMRGLAEKFQELELKPPWVESDAHPAVHFDQFLHAFYYVTVRGGGGSDDDDEGTSVERVERFFQRNKQDPTGALNEAAHWWAGLEEGPFEEDVFIRDTAPEMRRLFSRESMNTMDQDTFRAAIRHVNAFRMHARQVKNTEFDLPKGYSESLEERTTRLADWLWTKARSESGRSALDVFKFVIWGTEPADMERRLWTAFNDDKWYIRHLGRSILGETVGWARPDDFPPRNNRTNKALRALGHDVRLFFAN